jgi:soluble lytic murein transglycosylase-like protein
MIFMRNILNFLIFIFIYFSFSAQAKARNIMQKDREIIESSKCLVHFKGLERKYKIPSDLLHSISLQESGRKHSNSDKKLPWPWTVNVEGKGYFFNSKSEAVNFVRKEFSKGKKSIDVGCMQISMLYHGDAFNSISDAFEPKNNVEYGALFLKEKFEQYGSWKKAIANYHSADFERGTKYQKSVLNIASNIDKHKFNVRKTRNILESSKPLYVSNFKQSHLPYFSYKEKSPRYKSNMMVYVPKYARRVN